MINRKNAYTEVYTILQDLDEDSNCKIDMFGTKVLVNCYVWWLAKNS